MLTAYLPSLKLFCLFLLFENSLRKLTLTSCWVFARVSVLLNVLFNGFIYSERRIRRGL